MMQIGVTGPKTPLYPTAWMVCSFTLEDFGQSNADAPISFQGFPHRVRVEREPHNHADTFEVDVDFESFPFSSEIVRGGTVQIFIGAAESGSDVDFWGTLSGTAPLGATATPAAALNDFRSKCVMAGVIDEFHPKFDSKKGRLFTMKGRDYTAYFLDSGLEPGFELKWTDANGQPLSILQIYNGLIQDPNRVQFTGNLTVSDPDGVGATTFPAKYKQAALDDPLFSTRKGRHGEVVWDLIQEIAFEAGLYVFMDLDQLVIRLPKTMFLGQGDPADTIRYTLGNNILDFETIKKLGRQHNIAVRVTSFNGDTGQPLRAYASQDGKTGAAAEFKVKKIPATRVGGHPPKVLQPTQPALRPFVVRGITSQTQLQAIADQIVEELRHHETEVKIKTHELADSLGNPVTTFRYGDPVVIDIAEGLQSIITLPTATQIQRLLDLGYEDATVGQIVDYTSKLRVPYYVHRMTFDLDVHEGFSLELEARSRKQVDTTVA